MSSNIEKFRRNIHAPGMSITGTGSIATVNLTTATIATANITTANITGNFTGSAVIRGRTSIVSGDATVTISASAVTSGAHIDLSAVSSAGQLIPSSIVDDTSFMAETVDGAVSTPLTITYLIVR